MFRSFPQTYQTRLCPLSNVSWNKTQTGRPTSTRFRLQYTTRIVPVAMASPLSRPITSSSVSRVQWPFALCHVAAGQGTATPTACWESWWARAPGRWRRGRRESSASGRGRRSWRNAPAPRRCCPPGASTWPRSNRRPSIRCGTSTLCCECSTLLLSSLQITGRGDMCDTKDSQFRLFHANTQCCQSRDQCSTFLVSEDGALKVFIVSV